MLQTRTTVSMNDDYLQSLKMMALKRQASLSLLINEAVRFYLSQISRVDNRQFFQTLTGLKNDLGLNKKQLLANIQKGRQ